MAAGSAPTELTTFGFHDYEKAFDLTYIPTDEGWYNRKNCINIGILNPMPDRKTSVTELPSNGPPLLAYHNADIRLI